MPKSVFSLNYLGKVLHVYIIWISNLVFDALTIIQRNNCLSWAGWLNIFFLLGKWIYFKPVKAEIQSAKLVFFHG